MVTNIRIGTLLGLVAVCGALAGCRSNETPAENLPKVEFKTMDEIGKLTPEQEAAALRRQDPRPAEDRSEGGL
ncbi:MAG: hypothetical protein SNJ74_01285 [Fimbriimonadaceae bacterium]